MVDIEDVNNLKSDKMHIERWTFQKLIESLNGLISSINKPNAPDICLTSDALGFIMISLSVAYAEVSSHLL